MNKMKLAIVTALSLVCLNVCAEEVQGEIAAAADCSTMSADMQQFAAQLSAQNKMMFCGQFTGPQRAAAMQMAGQPDETGAMMTGDQAVQKVASSNKMTPNPKTPTGCPVK
jgi:hypothetical protein